ncbi:MAG: Glycogen synthase [Chlamydiia bacterium]|nr:Glycogen synthase [Chlamydiia bacterium]
MHITHVATEFSPFAKAGGLGDVIHGLSRQQVKDGHTVSVILPKYDIIDIKFFEAIEIYVQDLWTYEDGVEFHNTVYKTSFEDITIYLIEPHHNCYYFNRGLIYGAMNDTERFLYFSRTATEFLNNEKQKPHILHLHDWPTAAMVPLIRFLTPQLNAEIKSLIFNVHNMEHQGRIHPKYLSRIGLNGADFLSKERMQDPVKPEMINLLKGAITYSDQVVTVSPTYAQEIKTPEFSFGLTQTVEKFKSKLHGILNGIEIDTWNPKTDQYISHKYPANSTFIHDIIRNKELNKKALFKELGLAPKINGPLVICITRIASQKAPELILHALKQVNELGGTFILLGSICEPQLEKDFHQAKAVYKNHPNIHLCFEFKEDLAHKLFAAADAIFIPSKFEPCGLTQIISMRYGTVPIGRNTGGLKDTITDISKPLSTGFIFNDLAKIQVDKALEKAFDLYANHPSKWQSLIQNGMNRDASWAPAAALYEKIYTCGDKLKIAK